MDAATITLQNNSYIKELVKIFSSESREAQANTLLGLASYIDRIEKELTAVHSELTDIAKRLNRMEGHNDKKKGISQLCKSLSGKIHEFIQKIQSVKQRTANAARKTIENYQNKGMAALDNVLEYTNIEEKLKAMKASLDNSVASTKQSIAKVDAVGFEARGVFTQLRNVGRVIRGKERLATKEENGIFTKTIEAPLKLSLKRYSGLSKVFGSALQKTSALKRKTETAKEKISSAKKERDKASILDALKSNRDTITSQKANQKTQNKTKEAAL